MPRCDGGKMGRRKFFDTEMYKFLKTELLKAVDYDNHITVMFLINFIRNLKFCYRYNELNRVDRVMFNTFISVYKDKKKMAQEFIRDNKMKFDDEE